MILPATGDEQVLPGAALDPESEPAQHPGAPAVARHVARHDAVQLQHSERVRDRRAQRLRHVAVSLLPTVERVAEPATLERAPDDVREAHGPDHTPADEHEEPHRAALTEFARVHAHLPAPVILGEERPGPRRIPRCQVATVAAVVEAVSQILPQQDHDATELDETQKIRNFVFMTGDQSAEVLKPSEQALDFPAAAIAPQRTAVLGLHSAITSLTGDQLDAVFGKIRPERVAVEGFVADESLRRLLEKAGSER